MKAERVWQAISRVGGSVRKRGHIHPFFSGAGSFLLFVLILSSSCKSLLTLSQDEKLGTGGVLLSGPFALESRCLLTCTLQCSSELSAFVFRSEPAFQRR